MSQDERINRYSETALSGKRRYELSQDKILIRGSVSGSYDYERTFELAKLNADLIPKEFAARLSLAATV